MRAPREAYCERLAIRRAAQDALARRVALASNARLGSFTLLVAGTGLSLWREDLPGSLLVGLPLALFVTCVVLHRRAAARRARAGRAVAFYERGLARLDHRFRGTGEAGSRFADEGHPYAAQLDLFGPGSLFELLCGARTETGRERLAAWLIEPAPTDEIRARHEALGELRERLDLREELAVLGDDLPGAVEEGGLREWTARPAEGAGRGLRVVLALLAAANVAVIAAWALGWSSLAPLAPLGLLELGIWLRCRGRVRKVLANLARPAAHVTLLGALLRRLERERFAAPCLARLRARLDADGPTASTRLRGLERRIELLESRSNQLFAPLAPLLLFTTQLAFSIEEWRVRHGPELAGWLDAVGELEALLDLAGYAFDHPDDPLPELEEPGPCFVASDLGHPLIPEEACVRNDVQLDGALRLFVVSGSNMSGKSTLMRSVGINAVLALAGAPVRARELRVSPLAVAASFRVLDSLQDGVSHFQAELLRVRLVASLAGGDPPLLFLLDEIFQGTNSHDRVQGATAIVRGLCERGSLGMISTHDLKLTEIVASLGERARNVHFEDALENGEMSFDYRLRDGVVERSNAVALMRAVGLEV